MQTSLEQILSSYDDQASLSQASTIPAEWYVDARVAELERLSVFSKTWQLVARTDQVKAAGEFVTTTVAGEPVVVVRGRRAGRLRACSVLITDGTTAWTAR
jgi:choline monooxygenase